MNYIITLLLLISSTISLAGSISSLRTDADGNVIISVRGEDSIGMPFTRSGSYLPVFASDVNCTGSASTSQAHWMQVGKIISVSGSLSCVVTSINIDTQVTFSVPPEFSHLIMNELSVRGHGTISRGVNGTLSAAIHVEALASGHVRVRTRRSPAAASSTIYYTYKFELP